MSLARPSRPLSGAAAQVAATRGLGDVLRQNSLSIVMFSLFVLFLIGQSIAGWLEHNQEAREHGQ